MNNVVIFVRVDAVHMVVVVFIVPVHTITVPTGTVVGTGHIQWCLCLIQGWFLISGCTMLHNDVGIGRLTLYRNL